MGRAPVPSSPAPVGRRGFDASWLPALPAFGLVFVFLVLPLVLMLRTSFNRFVPGQLMMPAFTLENYLAVASEPFYRDTLGTTIFVATLTTLICLACGLPVAYFLARVGARRIKGLLIIMIILPLFTGNAVRTAGWMIVLGDHGVINRLLMGAGLVSEPVKMLYTPWAVVIGLTSVLLPFMIVTLQSVMEGIDRSVEEASCSLGATPLRTFWRVVVPLAMPGIVAGVLLCFILALNAYATPFLLGGPKFRMMAPVLYQQITAINNWPMGASLGFVLMSVSLVLSLLSALMLRSRKTS